MKNFMLNRLLDKASEGDGGGGFPKPPIPKPPEQQPAAEKPPETPAEGDTTDPFGYEALAEETPSKKEGTEKPPGDNPPKDTPPTPEKIEQPATGYGDKPPEVKEPPKPDEKPPEAPPADDLDKALEGLPKGDVEKAKKFFTENKDKPVADLAKAYAELRKQEMKEAQDFAKKMEQEAELERQRTRAAWHKELKEDSTFGGEKFDYHVSRAEKVLGEFMPQTKKALTERGSMLPPYVMRDLAKLAEHLYKTERLQQGDPPAPAKSKDDEDSPYAFYTMGEPK